MKKYPRGIKKKRVKRRARVYRNRDQAWAAMNRMKRRAKLREIGAAGHSFLGDQSLAQVCMQDKFENLPIAVKVVLDWAFWNGGFRTAYAVSKRAALKRFAKKHNLTIALRSEIPEHCTTSHPFDGSFLFT